MTAKISNESSASLPLSRRFRLLEDLDRAHTRGKKGRGLGDPLTYFRLRKRARRPPKTLFPAPLSKFVLLMFAAIWTLTLVLLATSYFASHRMLEHVELQAPLAEADSHQPPSVWLQLLYSLFARPEPSDEQRFGLVSGDGIAILPPAVFVGLGCDAVLQLREVQRRYLFLTGVRVPVLPGLEAIHTFLRVANHSGRVLVGPFISRELAFKMSRFVNHRRPAADFMGQYFSLNALQKFPSACLVSTGVGPEAVCGGDDEGALARACIGPMCKNRVNLLPEESALTDADDVVDIFAANAPLRDARCVVVHDYVRGFRDPWLKSGRYARELYGGRRDWTYRGFPPSDAMERAAREFRAARGLEAYNYVGVHLRAEQLIREGCDSMCSCGLSELVEAMLRVVDELSDERSSVYVAWDVSTTSYRFTPESVLDAQERMRAEFGSRLNMERNYMDAAAELFSDVINVATSRTCVNLGGGSASDRIDATRAAHFREPCLRYTRLQPVDGRCELVG